MTDTTSSGYPANDDGSDELGPVDYLLVEFPADRQPDGSALVHLLDLVDKNIIRVLDLCFIRRGTDGSTVGVDVVDLGLQGDIDITVFAQASTGLVDHEDIADAGSALTPGCSAALLVYENRWAAPFATALRHSGAQLVADGRIPVNALLASMED